MVIKMAKKLVKALSNGVYVGSIVGCSTSKEISGVKKVFDLFDNEQLANVDSVDFYSLKIQLSDRIITVNKFCNKVIWTDSNGDGWTSCDFFTSGLQRQLGLEDVTDDVEIFKLAKDVNFYISQYVNPTTGVKSYNVDTSKPKSWDAENNLGLEF